MSTEGLDGVSVLVTRPSPHGEALSEAIRQLGGEPVLFPGVHIEPAGKKAVVSMLATIESVDLAVFVSPTAVRLGVPALIERFGSIGHLRLAAVGAGTAAALNEVGLHDVIVPRGAGGGSALAACPQLKNVAGTSVLLVRGAGGNDVLEKLLVERGARVSSLACYQRSMPTEDFGAIARCLREGRIDAWMATSGEILDNLLTLAGDEAALLRRTPLFVNHPQVARRAFSNAVQVIFVTSGGDAGIGAGLSTWFCKSRSATS